MLHRLLPRASDRHEACQEPDSSLQFGVLTAMKLYYVYMMASHRRVLYTGITIIITGNGKFFSAGADLQEITALTAREALEFARAGQA